MLYGNLLLVYFPANVFMSDAHLLRISWLQSFEYACATWALRCKQEVKQMYMYCGRTCNKLWRRRVVDCYTVVIMSQSEWHPTSGWLAASCFVLKFPSRPAAKFSAAFCETSCLHSSLDENAAVVDGWSRSDRPRYHAHTRWNSSRPRHTTRHASSQLMTPQWILLLQPLMSTYGSPGCYSYTTNTFSLSFDLDRWPWF